MKEALIPLSVVKDMIEQLRREQTLNYTRFHDYMKSERDFNKHLIEMLGVHLAQCATLFERALNPPIPPQQEIPEHTTDMPRMSEEEEDWYFAYQNGDITKAELDAKLKTYMNGAYAE